MKNEFDIKFEEIFQDKFGSKKRVFNVTNYTRNKKYELDGKIGEIRYNAGFGYHLFISESPSYLLDVKSLRKIANFINKLIRENKK